MNVEFISSFIESVTDVLHTMAQTECSSGTAAPKKEKASLGDVTGIIGMSGDKSKGSFAISFSEDVILAITEKMLGEKISTLDSTVIDLVGELTNIATGGAKKRLSEAGYDFDMATPVVVTGENHQIDHLCKGPTIVVPFTSAAGDFFIEMSFSEV